MFFLFFGEPKTSHTDEKRIIFRNILREFVVQYRQNDGTKFKPSTIVGVLISLNTSLHINKNAINIFKHLIFTDKTDVLIPLLDSRCADQQAKGAIVKHHNNLPRSDVFHILDHEIFNAGNSLGNVYKYVIAFVIALGVIPTQI